MNNTKVMMLYGAVFWVALLIHCLIFYPGYMSFDSAYQYSQVVSGEWNNISPIIMVSLWTLTDAIIPGPGGLYLLFQIIALLGLTLFMAQLRLNHWLKICLLLLIYFWPFNLMIMPHLWKDVGLMSFSFLALGCLQVYKHHGRFSFFIMALLALLVSSMFRFEAILYLSPVAFYLVLLLLRRHNKPTHFVKLLLLTMAVIFTSMLATQAITKLTDSKKITLWQTVALWDMARVSVKINQQLLPAFTTGPGMTVKDLQRANVPWTNTHLFSKTKTGVNSGLGFPYTQQQNKGLFKAWLKMIQTHPLAYLSHRTEVAAELLRVNDSTQKPIDIFYTRNNQHFSDGHTFNNSKINTRIANWIDKHLNDFYFKGWMYLLLHAMVLLLVLTKKKSELAVALCCSGIMSMMALTLLAPSAEQRYLIWLINSSLLSLMLTLSKSPVKASS